MRQFTESLKLRGWLPYPSAKNNHLKMQWPHAPEEKGVIVIPSTPSDPRSILNITAFSRRVEEQYPKPEGEDPKSLKKRYNEQIRQESEDKIQKINESLQSQNPTPTSAPAPEVPVESEVAKRMRLKREQRDRERPAWDQRYKGVN
jgi:hypothetical protein